MRMNRLVVTYKRNWVTAIESGYTALTSSQSLFPTDNAGSRAEPRKVSYFVFNLFHFIIFFTCLCHPYTSLQSDLHPHLAFTLSPSSLPMTSRPQIFFDNSLSPVTSSSFPLHTNHPELSDLKSRVKAVLKFGVILSLQVL